MAEVKDYLKSQGYSDEEVAEGMKNEKLVKTLAEALEKAGRIDSAEAAVAEAKAESARLKAESDEFWGQSQAEINKALAAQKALKEQNDALQAQLSAFRTYNKTLKEQGYAAPDEYVNVPEPEPDKPMTRKEWESEQRKLQSRFNNDVLAVNDFAAEYQHLIGTPYTSSASDFEEARKHNKPFVEYARGKYEIDKKRDERKASEQKKLNDAEVERMYKAKEAELTAKYGNMPELRPPSVSSQDSIKEKFGVEIKKNMTPAQRKEVTRQIWATLPKVPAKVLIQ